MTQPVDWKSLGLTDSLAAAAIDLGKSEPDPESFWRRLCQQWETDFPAPSAVRAVWDYVFADWDETSRPRPLWSPDLNQIQETNIATWAAELGILDFDQIHAWSINQRAEFWTATTEKLNIQFDKIGDTILTSDDPATASWFPEARLNIVESCFLSPPEETAIVSQRPGGSIQKTSYAELRKLSHRISNGLDEQGFVAGDAIAVVLPMTVESVAVYLGIVQAGMVVVSIADSFAAAEISNRLRIANARAVFTYDQMMRAGKPIDLYDRVREATELPIFTIPLSEDNVINCQLREMDLGFHDFLSANDQFEPVIRGSQDAINILFSSGTTGDPKAIPWTQLTPIKCAIDGFIHQDIRKGTVAAWPTNLGWMMGPWLIIATLINRGTIALYEDVPMGAGFGEFVQDAKVNMLGVVPTIVKAWRDSECMEPFDWSAIRCFSSTGEASQSDDMFYLSALANMRPIIEYCGGTEIGGGYITSTMAQPNVAAAFSTPAIGLGVEILDVDDQVADEGELFLIGPSIGLSETLLNRDHRETYYSPAPQLPDGTQLRKHGDFMCRLPGDYFVAGGRADDTMNLGGIKVSSAEIERVLNQIEGIRETAAVAISDGGPERLAVFFVPDSSDIEIGEESLRQQMNGKLKALLNPLFKVSSVERIDAMPRTASNKVMRRKLRDRLCKPATH